MKYQIGCYETQNKHLQKTWLLIIGDFHFWQDSMRICMDLLPSKIVQLKKN